MKMTLSQVALAVNGELVGQDLSFNGISTDTRTVQNGMLFIPIEGENFDGHNFISEAVKKGAVAVISHRDEVYDVPFVRVSDTRKALGMLALFHRKSLDVKVVGITGSTGKTTTKDIIANVLSQKYKTLKTEGNFNNDIGVPLTLFRLNEDDECAVIEMGMNHFNEISNLTEMALPDVSVITNVGVSHIENLGSREGILKAKCEIFQSNPSQVKILNGDDDMLITVKEKYDNIQYFSLKNKDCAAYADNIKRNSIISIDCDIHTKNNDFSVTVPVPGEHMVSNALAATLVAEQFGLNSEQIKRGIETFKPTKMRMDIINTEKYTIINDVYNANPASVTAALDVLKNADTEKCAILGDMLELGDYSAKMHADMGVLAVKYGIEKIVFIGELSKYGFDAAQKIGLENAFYFKDKQAFFQQAGSILKQGTTILLKASRGMHFEEITEFLKQE